jgi:hypothetical protein
MPQPSDAPPSELLDRQLAVTPATPGPPEGEPHGERHDGAELDHPSGEHAKVKARHRSRAAFFAGMGRVLHR